MGRPPKHPAQVLSERIEVRVTHRERRRMVAAARLAGLRLSEWMRLRLEEAAEVEYRRR